MDHETRERLRIGIELILGDLPWKLLSGNEKGRDRSEQWRRQHVILDRLLAMLEGYEIKALPLNPFPGVGPSTHWRNWKQD